MRNIEDRIIDQPGTDAVAGKVHWDPVKSIWWSAMTAGWIVGGTLWFSWGAVGAFLIMSTIILCGGHSLGMHRRLIHESFDCPRWLTLLGVWLGTLVGLGGPGTMMQTHDLRDWAQRQPDCHPYLRHGHGPLRDFLWQLHCSLTLSHPPVFKPSSLYRDSRLMQWLQRTAFLQQLPVAVVLWAIGGPGFVAWAVCGRVSISIFGHWAVGWNAHNHGHRDFHNEGHCTQGHNVRGFGLVTFGEAYHNNHHAFPESARLGIFPGQPDPGWWVLQGLRRLGWVWNVVEADVPDVKRATKKPAVRQAFLSDFKKPTSCDVGAPTSDAHFGASD